MFMGTSWIIPFARKVSDKGGACKVVILISSALFFGNTKSWFGASRGVRLCDPLSTFLFALMVYMLAY